MNIEKAELLRCVKKETEEEADVLPELRHVLDLGITDASSSLDNSIHDTLAL